MKHKVVTEYFNTP